MSTHRPYYSGLVRTPQCNRNSLLKISGRWYEVERTFVMAEVGWRCITVDYKEESGRVRVETSGNAVKFVDPIKKPNNGCSNKREDLWFSGYKCHQQTKSETCPARKLPRRYKMKKLTSFS
ncbi:hypothetical protein TNCT_398761 [Trichonephila clavata]|uniref:Uncharacterized protein n=1 Tax=Trichonephila clavata TaxID=2740835 RepID=A0A8X6J3K0_TRICU|nr:hypothetical protein TNCT_398761 [Trichonephila clavata]